MCGRFTVVGEDGLGLAMEAIEAGSWDGSPDDARAYGRLDRSEARPTALVQVVARDGGIVSVPMIWGFSVSWQRNVVFNARIFPCGLCGRGRRGRCVCRHSGVCGPLVWIFALDVGAGEVRRRGPCS